MAIPGPGGLFGVTGPSSIAEDAITATVIVGNTAEGDIAGITCHVLDDIAAGIALLPAVGGTVHIKRGVYTPAATIAINASNVTIQAEAGVRINKLAGNDLFDLQSGNSNITIRNIENLNGQGDATGGHLINVTDCTNVTIMDCTFLNQGAGGDGIHIEGTVAGGGVSNMFIYRCNFNSLERGIYAESTDAAAVSVTDLSIVSCLIDDTLEEGIELVLLDRATILNTRVFNTGSSGAFDAVFIRGKAAGVRSSNHNINDLWIDNATDDGLELEFVDDSSFVKVMAINNNRDGINFNDVDRSVVANCVCRLNGDDGIDINAASDRNSVRGNQCTGNGDQPIIDNGTNNQVVHNIIA
jgi:parallel beta-helix repeat protein